MRVNFGKRIKIKPKSPYTRIPFPVMLRKNVLPKDNRKRKNPLPILDSETEVVWNDYWNRRLVRGEIEIVSEEKKEIKEIKKDKKK